jgi:hypothetical protein
MVSKISANTWLLMIPAITLPVITFYGRVPNIHIPIATWY